MSHPTIHPGAHWPQTLGLVWQPVPGNHMNRSWQGTDATGPCWILRRYERTGNSAEILDEHRLLCQLQEAAGTLIAPPVPLPRGGTLLRDHDHCFALFPFRSGVTMVREDDSGLRLAATALAHLHLQLLAMDMGPDCLIRRPPLADRSLHLDGPDDEDLRRQTGLSTDVSGRFKQVLGNLPPLPPPVCPIHGDYGPRNILWDPVECRVTAVLDWEEWRLDHPACDVVAATASFTDAGVGNPGSGFARHYIAALARLSKERAAMMDDVLHSHWNALAVRIWAHELHLCLQGSFGSTYPVHYIKRLVTLITEALA